jgi:hypothetical protein
MVRNSLKHQFSHYTQWRESLKNQLKSLDTMVRDSLQNRLKSLDTMVRDSLQNQLKSLYVYNDLN